MKLNVDKCKGLHIGNNNQYIKDTMNCSELSKVNHEKDLGVTISNDLKPDKKKARKLVGFIGRTFEYKSEKLSLHYIMHSYALI